MKRDLTPLGEKEFDVLVIGGGIYGVCTAWDAALRGLSVALIERGDFGSATSSNSLKIIHGGLRYLQHADFKRMRESITERRVLMRIAPHLVHPLKCVMPTYGHSLKGKEVMALALWINDVVGLDRNRTLPPEKALPAGKVLSRSECLALIPGVEENGLSGAALWYDCQVYNSERLLISILKSAVDAGAVAANYVEMVDFVKRDERVLGVTAQDKLSGERFEIRARVVVNNAGPWVNDVLARLNGRQVRTGTRLSSAMNLVVKRRLFPEYAVGVWSKSRFEDADALVKKGARLYFITPWRDYTVIGTTHDHYDGDPSRFAATEEDVAAFLREVNEALPTLQVSRDEVTLVYAGLLPIDEAHPSHGDIKLLKHYQIIDHRRRDGLDGLITVVGVKFTTARDVARHTVDRVFEHLDKVPPRCRTAETPVAGGDMESFRDFVQQEKRKNINNLNARVLERLLYNYGTEYDKVVKCADKKMEWLRPVDENSGVLAAEVVHAVREEMAVKLADVVRRRTELGSAEPPTDAALQTCAELMAAELGWDAERVEQEKRETKALYR